MERVYQGLEKGIPARAIGLTDKEKFFIKSMGLLTLKPVCYAFNVDEVDYLLDREKIINKIQKLLRKVDYFDAINDIWTLVSAKLEAERSLLSDFDRTEYLNSFGIDDFDQVTHLFSIMFYQR